jgi:hypothetical protein
MHQDPAVEPARDAMTRGVVTDREPVVRSELDIPSASEPVFLAVATSHWRSTLAGTLAALSTLLFLGLLGLALGLSQFNAATSATQGALPAGFGRNVGMWTAFSLLVAFMAGGFVAARTESVRLPERGAWRGAMVFAMASPLLLWLLLGGLAGTGGAVAGSIAGLHVDPATQARVNPTAVGDVAGHLRDATWFSLFGCLLGLAASAIGGLLAVPRATRPTPHIRVRGHDHRRDQVHADSGVRLDETAPLDSTRRGPLTGNPAERATWSPRGGR